MHLGRVSPHAVDGQEQIHEGKRGVQPQQIRPGHENKTFYSRRKLWKSKLVLVPPKLQAKLG